MGTMLSEGFSPFEPTRGQEVEAGMWCQLLPNNSLQDTINEKHCLISTELHDNVASIPPGREDPLFPFSRHQPSNRITLTKFEGSCGWAAITSTRWSSESLSGDTLYTSTGIINCSKFVAGCKS